MFYDHKRIKLEINYRKNNKKIPKHMEIKQDTSKETMDQSENPKFIFWQECGKIGSFIH